MPRALARPASPGRHAQPLSEPYWTQLTSMRVPGGRDRIDLVVVGPSGVHVVLDRAQPPHSSSRVGEADTELVEVAQRAVAAAAAVAELLPPRYRHLVTSEVSLNGVAESAVIVGAALAASPDVMRHVWRHRPRVVSTSEAAVIVTLLRGALEPFPVEPTTPHRPWWRRRSRRWAIAGAATVAGVSAAVAAAVTLGMPPL